MPTVSQGTSSTNEGPSTDAAFQPTYICDPIDSYDGYIDHGQVDSGYNGSSATNTLSFSISRTVSNAFSCDASFPIQTVDAKFGYSHSWSSSKTWGYSAVVNPGKTVHIGYEDEYHVHDFAWEIVSIMGKQSGTGWTEQWFSPYFYSWES